MNGDIWFLALGVAVLWGALVGVVHTIREIQTRLDAIERSAVWRDRP